MLNIATIAAIVAAVWAHPQGVSYLEKIDQIEARSIACGNPCCQGSGQHRPTEEELWRSLPDFIPWKPAEVKPVDVLPEVTERIVKVLEPSYTSEDIKAVVNSVLSKLPQQEVKGISTPRVANVVIEKTKEQPIIASSQPIIDSEDDDEEALFLLGLL